MALRRQIVYFVRLHLLQYPDKIRCIGHISVMENESFVLLMGILVQVVDPIGVKQGTASFDPVDHIPLVQEKFRQIRPILPGNTSY